MAMVGAWWYPGYGSGLRYRIGTNSALLLVAAESARWPDALQICVQRRLRIEVKDRPQHLLQLLHCQVRNMMVKNQIYVRSAWIINGIVLGSTRTSHSAIHPDLNVLIPLGLLYRAAIDFEMETVTTDIEFGDHRAIAWLN